MNSVYNSPPNWPTSPAGWTPPPGWTPDPSWPEPPPNWQFWVTSAYQPPSRGKPWLWLVIGVVTATVLIVVLGITGAIIALVNADDNVTPAQAAASSYAQAMKDQRYDAAFAMRCAERAGDHDEFVADLTARTSAGRGLTAFKIVGTHVQSMNGRKSATVSAEVRYADGTKKIEQMTLTKPGDTWMPCN